MQPVSARILDLVRFIVAFMEASQSAPSLSHAYYLVLYLEAYL